MMLRSVRRGYVLLQRRPRTTVPGRFFVPRRGRGSRNAERVTVLGVVRGCPRRGSADALANLQPLHWLNNRAKADHWPDWECRKRS